MKTLLIILVAFIASVPAFSQTVKPCTGFKDPNADTKPHSSQYAMSSRDAIDKSKKGMAEQSDQFDKKKYQAVVKTKVPGNHKRNQRML